MKKYLIALSILLAAFGIYGFAGQASLDKTKNETWLHNAVPTKIAGFTLLPKTEGSKVSYRMDDLTYRMLEPVGIAGQHFQDRNFRMIDVVTIAGYNSTSFHDQRLCFVGGGWKIDEDKVVDMKSSLLGNYQVRNMEIEKDQSKPKHAIFVFQGPDGFTVEYNQMRSAYIKTELLSGKPIIGFSFRFIALTDDISRDELNQFANEFIEKANEGLGRTPGTVSLIKHN